MSDSQRTQRAYEALPKLLGDLDAISADGRGDRDLRHVAEHAVRAFYHFLCTLRREDVPERVIDAVTELIAGLDAIDRGESHFILAPPRRKAGRPATPFDKKMVLGALLSALDYLRREGATSTKAFEGLSRDLNRAGLKVTPSKLSDLQERAVTGDSPKTLLEAADEYERAVRYLAKRLPSLLKPIRRAR